MKLAFVIIATISLSLIGVTLNVDASGWCGMDEFSYYNSFMKSDNVFRAKILAVDPLPEESGTGLILFQTTKIYKGEPDIDWSINARTTHLSTAYYPPIYGYYESQFEENPEKTYVFVYYDDSTYNDNSYHDNSKPYSIRCIGDEEFDKIHSYSYFRIFYQFPMLLILLVIPVIVIVFLYRKNV